MTWLHLFTQYSCETTSGEERRSRVLVLNNSSKRFALSPNTNFPGNCLGKFGNLLERSFV